MGHEMNDEQAAINRRQKIAEMMMAQGQEPLETNQMAGGYVVPVSPLAGVAKVAQQLAGAYVGRKADDMQSAYDAKKLAELQGIDLNSPDAPSKLMHIGKVTEAITAQKALKDEKKGREGVPTGFTANPDGTITPMPITGGGTYADYQLRLSDAKKQTPGYGEAEKLDMAKEDQGLQRAAAIRAEEASSRQRELEAKKLEQMGYENDLKNWQLQNPNYDKNSADIADAESGFETLKNGVEAYKKVLDGYSNFDRHNPMANGDLQTNYQAATWPLRGESMINTGVLNPGDMKALNAAIQDPTEWSAKGFRDNAAIKSQLDELLKIAERNVESKRKSLSPLSPPPVRGGGPNWQKVDDVKDEVKGLRKSGEIEAANQLEALDKKQRKVIKFDANGNMVQ